MCQCLCSKGFERTESISGLLTSRSGENINSVFFLRQNQPYCFSLNTGEKMEI